MQGTHFAQTMLADAGQQKRPSARKQDGRELAYRSRSVRYYCTVQKGTDSCTGVPDTSRQDGRASNEALRIKPLIASRATGRIKSVVCCELGSKLIRRADFPEHSFPSIVGRPILRAEERGSSLPSGVEIKDIMCVLSLLLLVHQLSNSQHCTGSEISRLNTATTCKSHNRSSMASSGIGKTWYASPRCLPVPAHVL